MANDKPSSGPAKRKRSKDDSMGVAAPDHWIYDEGPSVAFILGEIGVHEEDAAAPAARWNSTALRLRDALKEAIEDEEPVSADEVSDLIERDSGEDVEWVASTFVEFELLNLYICRFEGEPDSVVATHHGDGGVIAWMSGPWASVEEAKGSIGDVPEGWTEP